MPITENVDSDVDRGCERIMRGRSPGRIALGGSCRGSNCVQSGATSRRAIRKEQCEYCNGGTRDSVTHGEGLRVSEYSTACETAGVTRKFALRIARLEQRICPGGQEAVRPESRKEFRADLGRGQAHAHIHSLRGVRERPDRDEIHSGLSVSANVFQRDAA
jgi:hypothetical protein